MSIADGWQTDFSEPARLAWRAGVLSTRPAAPTNSPMPSGTHWLSGVGGAALYVPSTVTGAPIPLVVVLHGAASNPSRGLSIVQEEADLRTFLVLAPKSEDYTWDVIRGGFGPDVGGLDRALATVFDHFPIDRRRIAIGGFSDGASYALSLGLINGELFSHILAFSPGFVVPGRRDGHPRVFVSHGHHDTVLPIDRCSRRIVRTLRSEAYDVDYREFAGGHEVPADMVTAAIDLLAS